MILGVDASRLVPPVTGVGRDLEDLLLAWAGQELPFERIELFSPAPLPGLPRDERFRLHVLGSRGPGIWWKTREVGRWAPSLDVLFAQYGLPVGHRGASVVSNHGVLEGRHRAPLWNLPRRARRRHFAYSARRADRVIAVSDVVKDDLVRWYGVPPEKVIVSRPGIREIFRPRREGEEDAGVGAPYLLFVGKLSPRRHMPRLLEAFARIASDHAGLCLLVVGPDAAGPLEELAARLGVAGRVRFCGYIDEETLAALYRGAAAFVLPTTLESWSRTMHEALASGTPVVTVDGPWLDVYGVRDAVLALPAPEVELIADALRRVLDDAESSRLRENAMRVAAGFRRCAENAREVMAVLEEVARSRG